MRMIKKPVSDSARFDRVWQTHVYAHKGAYRMNE
jgi:poly(A) polymerase Pap1